MPSQQNQNPQAGEQSDSPESGSGLPVSRADEKLLQQIREDYRYCLDYWKENRAEMAIDMDYVAGQPWTADDLIERKGRPCLTPDELSQYVKSACNNLRQNKRAIKVIPRGEGASDKDAERRGAIIRGIENASNAQSAYTRGFEACVESSMGAWRVTTELVRGAKRGELQPRIKSIANQFTVLFDPNAKEADFSDGTICFVTDILRKTEFARKYPGAQKTSFTPQDQSMAPDWFDGENIIIAEYWHVEKKARKKLQLAGPAGETTLFASERPSGDTSKVLHEWSEDERKVTQYITNGVEILESNEWPGSWIPIVGVFGEEIYVNNSGRAKRMFMSLIRRARSCQKMLCFIASQEAEEFSMAPRVPVMLWEGQEQADEINLKFMNKTPLAYVKLRPTVHEGTGQLLPPPQQFPFQINAQAYELAYEKWRRAVQSGVGVAPLPTAAQRQNEKSGVALEKIQTQEATGSFHFTDNLDRSLEFTGRIVNELITIIMDTPQQVGIRKADDSHALLNVTTEEYGIPKDADPDDYLVVDRGEFDVTISTGPSFQSEREMASDFVDTLLKELAGYAEALKDPVIRTILSKAIKLKGVGVIGDEMADLLAPPNQANLPPEVQAQLQQLQGQLQQAQQEMQQMAFEKQAKIVDNQHKLAAEELKGQNQKDVEQMKEENKLAIAEVSTKAQNLSERMEFVEDMAKQFHAQAHERGMQAEEHSQAQDLAAQQAIQQSALSAQQGGQQAALADQSAGHAQDLAAQQADSQPSE